MNDAEKFIKLIAAKKFDEARAWLEERKAKAKASPVGTGKKRDGRFVYRRYGKEVEPDDNGGWRLKERN